MTPRSLKDAAGPHTAPAHRCGRRAVPQSLCQRMPAICKWGGEDGFAHRRLQLKTDRAAWPFPVRSEGCRRALQSVGVEGASALGDPALELGPEMADERLDGPGRGIAECADGMALDLLRHILQLVDHG